MGMPRDDYNDGPSMHEARRRHGRKLDECDFNAKQNYIMIQLVYMKCLNFSH